MPPLLIGACFGQEIFGRVMGLMGPARLPFTLSVPVVGGWLIDRNGGGALPEAYLPTFGLGVVLLVVCGFVLALVRIPRPEVVTGDGLRSAEEA